MNIEEAHVRRRAADPAAGGTLAIETSVREREEEGDSCSFSSTIPNHLSLSPSLSPPLSLSTQIKWSRLAPAAVIMSYTMAVLPAGHGAVRVRYEAAVDTATLPLPPPIRAVIETSMAASFHALVGKFVAFAADGLGGDLLAVGVAWPPEAGAAAVSKVSASPLLLLSPRAAASPRALEPPAPGGAALAVASWAAMSSRHWRLVVRDTEGDEYADAAETPRGLDDVWAGEGGVGVGGMGMVGMVVGTPGAAATPTACF